MTGGTLTLTLGELAGVVAAAVLLAASDPATVSRIGVAWLAKWLGVEPGEVVRMERATDGDPTTDAAAVDGDQGDEAS